MTVVLPHSEKDCDTIEASIKVGGKWTEHGGNSWPFTGTQSDCTVQRFHAVHAVPVHFTTESTVCETYM